MDAKQMGLSNKSLDAGTDTWNISIYLVVNLN